MTRRSGPSLLEAAVHRWVEAVLSKPLEEIMLHVASTPSLHAVGVLSEEAEAGILEIGKHLETSYFRSPAILVQFLYDSLAIILSAAPEENAGTAQVVARRIERLANPLQRFQFRAPLSLRGDLSWSGVIGGQHELALEALERDGQVIMVASGTVEAPTEPAAMVAIEEILETVLGLALALDLCSMLSPLPGAGSSVCLEIAPHEPSIPTRDRRGWY